MAYKPEHLPEWVRPNYWFGTPWNRWYVFLGQRRDSDTVTRSNFAVALDRLKKLPALETTDHSLGRNDVFSGGYAKPPFEVDTVQVVRERHSLVGWVEWIAIHESDSEALMLADDMQNDINNYPVLDETHLSDLEYSEAEAFWKTLSIDDRLHTLRGTGVSKFAARRDWVPSDDCGMVRDRLLGR